MRLGVILTAFVWPMVIANVFYLVIFTLIVNSKVIMLTSVAVHVTTNGLTLMILLETSVL